MYMIWHMMLYTCYTHTHTLSLSLFQISVSHKWQIFLPEIRKVTRHNILNCNTKTKKQKSYSDKRWKTRTANWKTQLTNGLEQMQIGSSIVYSQEHKWLHLDSGHGRKTRQTHLHSHQHHRKGADDLHTEGWNIATHFRHMDLQTHTHSFKVTFHC